MSRKWECLPMSSLIRGGRWLVAFLVAALPLCLTGCPTTSPSTSSGPKPALTGKETPTPKQDSGTPSTGMKAPHIPGN
jgi:hypothetical protein